MGSDPVHIALTLEDAEDLKLLMGFCLSPGIACRIPVKYQAVARSTKDAIAEQLASQEEKNDCWDAFANRPNARCCDHKQGYWGTNNVLGNGLPRKVWVCQACGKAFAEAQQEVVDDGRHMAKPQPDRAVVEVKACPACGFPENSDSGGCGVCDEHPEVLPTCPWCESPIKGRQFIKKIDGAWWHERCAWAKNAGLERGSA